MEIFINYFLLFFIYSIFGWILEVIYGFFQLKRFTNRGFLIGPYCPIYGVGCVLIIILLSGFTSHPFALFILSMVLCAVLEYYTGYAMEKLFKARWWDYSNSKFNINGRITLTTLIPFGLFACLLVYFINPYVSSFVTNLSYTSRIIFFVGFGTIFLIDNIISFSIVVSFKNTIKQISKNEIIDITEDINKYVTKLIKDKSILHKRLVDSFPKLKKFRIK